MNTLAMSETELLADAELVGLCLNGDRDAFGRIVERYQSLVCALAYSACGDLARSEDLAQETFIAAWRQLATLKEPAKLKYWLCGIVRNLIHNSVRAQTRNPLAAAVTLEDEMTGGPEWEAPSDEAMSKEEQTILWRVLETLPRSYRDPLVLFYRSGDSMAEVADALELSEEAVRQRLSRGRAMLNERVTRLVESGLRRSNPTKAFAVAVLAALPLASAQAGVASGVAATAKGTGALKTASGFGAFVTALVGIVPVLGGLVGLWGHVENTRTRRERRFIAWTSFGLVVWGIALALGVGLVVLGGGFFYGLQMMQLTTGLSGALGLSLAVLAFAAPLDVFAIWMALRQKQIRAEEGDSAQRPIEATRRGYKLSMYGSMLAMVFGMTGWLFLLANRVQDWTTIGVLLVLCLAGWWGSASLAVKRPTTAAKVMQVFIGLWWGLAFVNLAVANLRWSAWHGGETQLAPPGVNLLICVFFASIRAGWFLKERLLTVSTVRRDSFIALAVYAAVMVAGVALFKTVKATEVWEAQTTQCMINDIQTDGTIRFQSLGDFGNDSRAPLGELRFINSDFVHVERMSSAGGRALPFRVEHRDRTFAYVVPLTEAVPTNRRTFLKTEGYMTGLVRELGGGEREYFMRHWPANGVATLRVETYRLPTGAQVLKTTPADTTRHQLPDGRLELRTTKIIPPNGSITVRIRFRQPTQ